MSDILELLEAGDYPEGSDAELAVISAAVSLKRIADVLESLTSTGLPLAGNGPAAPLKRKIGGGARGAAAPAKPAPRTAENIAAGKPIPLEPINIPGDFTRWDGTSPGVDEKTGKPKHKKPDFDMLTEVTVIWRNGHIETGAAQQFMWGWTDGRASEILAYRIEPKDPAMFSAPSPALNVPLQRSPGGGVAEEGDE